MNRTMRAGSRRGLVAAASGLALLAWGAGAALAQDAGEVGEVVVTASRVRQLGFEAPTPTTVLGVEDIRKTGVTNLGQLQTMIPQFVATESPSNSAVRSGGGGAAFNLRGLTAPRTLFLLNSRRHVPNNPNGTTDTNVVPTAAIERVDVVTGGASAAWGSDAVAGVVNVILRKEMDGLEAQVQYGATSHGDNQEFKISGAWGTKFAGGRGRVLISGEYADNSGIPNVSDRDWSRANWGVVANPNYTPTNGQFQRLLVAGSHVNNATYGGLITTGVLQGTQFAPGGVPIRYNSGAFPAGSSGSYGGEGPNLNLGLNLMVPIERYAFYTRASYDLSDKVTLFVEGTLAQSKTDYDLVDNFNFGNITINADNAFLPAALKATLAAAGQTSFSMGRVNADFGGAIHDYNQNATRRGVIGLEGEFGSDWTWNAYYQFGDNREVTNEVPITKPANLALAADAVVAPNGQVVCRSTLTNPTNGCVPINLFGIGSPSAQAIRYVTGLGHRLTVYQQHAAEFSVAGSPFSTWAGPVSVAVGADYRRDTLRRRVDAESQANAFLIGNPKDIDGRISVKEVFGDAVIPLLKDQPFAKSLELEVADRFVDYSTTGSVNSWKVGLNWQMTDEIRFRATRSRDIRAPNANELFAFGGTQFATIRDPVSGRTFQTAIINAPNPDLSAEKADTTTVGVVYEPRWLPRLRLSVDYYDIDIQGAIVTIPAQDFVDRCQAGNQALCQVIQRNAAGEITQIQAGRVNLNQLLNRGIDFELAYAAPVPGLFGQPGQLSLRGLATYLTKNVTNDGRTAIDRAGVVLDGQPHWRANGNVTYTAGPLDLYTNIRYVGGGIYNRTYTAQSLNIQDFSGQTLIALGFQYRVKEVGGRPIELFGYINNLFDKAPPIIPDQQQQATMTNFTLYDTIGRTFMLGARLKY